MAEKYLKQENGILKEQEGLTTSSGASDAGKIPALDSTGKIDQSMMPVGIGADTATIQASEDLAAGDFVNIWDDSGTTKVRKADASVSGKFVDGFVLSAVTSGNNATVYFEGTNTQLTGLTGGSIYYLSDTTPGQVTGTPPSGAGKVVQKVGKAFSATEISFEKSDPIVLA